MEKKGAEIVYYIIGGTIIALGLALIIYACVKGLSKTKWEFPIGCLAITLGITLIFKNDIIAQIFPMLFGLILVTDGFARLKDSIVLGNKKQKTWWILLIVCIVYLILGLLAIFLDQKRAYLIMGCFAIVISVTDIIILSIFNKKLTAATNAFANELKSESTSNSTNQ
ncbi:MAG: DUF308 domain-containing protein [Malacoplasma sp.]|nr:DUF308 domain-containing protein [Malacoplasma sp.]